jgi:hypothetical protein
MIVGTGLTRALSLPDLEGCDHRTGFMEFYAQPSRMYGNARLGSISPPLIVCFWPVIDLRLEVELPGFS